MTKSRHINQPRIAWTKNQLNLLREKYPDSRTADLVTLIGRDERSIYAKAADLGIKKSAAFNASPASGRANGRQGTGTRFVKGQSAWNEGQHYQPGGRCAETQFKKGQMSGAAQHNYVPIGSLRVTKDGYLERKITDDQTIAPARRWVGVHRMVWIEANGKVPQGHVVVFKPGMRTASLEEITPGKVELVTRAELMKRNSYHNNYPKEIGLLIQLKGAVNRKINRRLKDERSTTE